MKSVSDWGVQEGEKKWQKAMVRQDFSHYKGSHLPLDILKQVYEEEKIDWEWEEGDRNLGLSDGAWEVLRGWMGEDA